MKVKMLKTRQGPKPMIAGEVYDLTEEQAERLIEAGKAEPVKGRSSGKTETAMKKSSPPKE